MDKELEVRAGEILKELVAPKSRRDGNIDYNLWHTVTMVTPNIDRAALSYMLDRAYVVQSSSGHNYRVTALGREHWDQINTWGPWYWYKKNWFPATVALATILVGVSTVAVNIWRVFFASCS